jgi:hypothetical protein
MVAGDASIHSEIYPKVCERVSENIKQKPNEWMKVETVARIYGEEVIHYKKRVVARLVLEPLDLTWATFLSKQKDFSPEWLDDISQKILEFKVEHKVIVSGLDGSGAHIWIVDGQGKLSCADKVGFAAIGIGKCHAESEFMFTKHTPYSTFPETLLRVYAAKKRAQVAPGVGEATDMFVVPVLGGGQIAPHEITQGEFPQLPATYSEMIQKLDEAKQQANKKMTEFLEQEMKRFLEQQANASDQIPPTPPSSPPSDYQEEGSGS